MEIVHHESLPHRTPTSMVVCIADEPEERSRLAGMFDGVGVLVMASDADSASSFLGQLHEMESEPTEGHSAFGVIRVGGLRLDITQHEATWHGQPLALTPYELKVLACLASCPGRVWTYRQLHDHVWDGSYFSGPAAVQSVIKRLRAKLRQSARSLHIDAVRGLGFRLAKDTGLHVVDTAV